MIVKELISRLNEIVNANPENVNAKVCWYDDFEGHIALGKGSPINLYAYENDRKNILCILNNIEGNPIPGCLIPINDNGEPQDD